MSKALSSVLLAPGLSVSVSDPNPSPPSPPPSLWDHPRSPLCAPAVPLLRLQFVLLCFRTATIGDPPLPSSPGAPSLSSPPSPPLGSSPHPHPPSAAALRGSSRGVWAAFCCLRRCPRLLKNGSVEEGYSSRGPPPPTCGGSFQLGGWGAGAGHPPGPGLAAGSS